MPRKGGRSVRSTRVAWSRVQPGAGAARQRRIARGVASSAGERLSLVRADRRRHALATWLDPMAAVVAADLGDDESARMHAQRALGHAQQLNQLSFFGMGAPRAWLCRDAARRYPGRRLEWYEQYVALVRDTENGVARPDPGVGRPRPSCAPGAARRGDTARRASDLGSHNIRPGAAPTGARPRQRAGPDPRRAERAVRRRGARSDDAIATCSRTLGSRLELARRTFATARAAAAQRAGSDNDARQAARGPRQRQARTRSRKWVHRDRAQADTLASATGAVRT